jgi:hypothetical protein
MTRTYKVEEVNAGICTCTLRAGPTEKCIEANAKQGWKFEQMEPIQGRFCLFFPRYKLLIVFSKEG